MAVQDMLKNIAETVLPAVKVNAVFGEAQQIGRKTIIPIATVGFGFGGGGGEGKQESSSGEPAQEGSGAGGGGGGSAKPLAVLEVTDEETKLIPIIDTTKVLLSAMALAGGVLMVIARIAGAKRK